VTWLASYDFFKFVGDSFDPVDDTNSTHLASWFFFMDCSPVAPQITAEIVENAFNNVDTLLNVSREGILEVAQLNATFMDIRFAAPPPRVDIYVL
jgi:hypothetical protein